MPLKPKDLVLLRCDRWCVYNALNFGDIYAQLFSAVSSCFVCCCARACEGSCCQHEILWLRWHRRQLPKPQEKVGGGRKPLLSSRESAESTFYHTFSFDWPQWPCLRSYMCVFFSFFFFFTVKWSHENLTRFLRWCLMWHQSVSLLHQASFIAKPQTICLWHQSLEALFTSGRNCTVKPFHLNDRNPLFTVHFYTHTTMSNISQDKKETET